MVIIFNKRSHLVESALSFSPVIKNLAVIGFNDSSVGIIDQHIRAAHVGPVGAWRRRGQVAQIPLLNGVFFGEIQWWNLVTGFEVGEVSNKAAQLILIDTGGGGCCGRRGPDDAAREQECTQQHFILHTHPLYLFGSSKSVVYHSWHTGCLTSIFL